MCYTHCCVTVVSHMNMSHVPHEASHSQIWMCLGMLDLNITYEYTHLNTSSCVTYEYESCPIWIPVMLDMNTCIHVRSEYHIWIHTFEYIQSCYTWIWVMSHMNTSSHVRYEYNVWIHPSRYVQLCDIRKWVMSHMNTSHVRYEYVYSCQIWMSHMNTHI